MTCKYLTVLALGIALQGSVAIVEAQIIGEWISLACGSYTYNAYCTYRDCMTAKCHQYTLSGLEVEF